MEQIFDSFKESATSLGLIGIIGNLGMLDNLWTKVTVKSKILLILCNSNRL